MIVLIVCYYYNIRSRNSIKERTVNIIKMKTFKTTVDNVKITEGLNDYFNGYTTFIMINKDMRKDIHKYRMNFLINYFIELNNNNSFSKKELINYYINNINDNYSGEYNPYFNIPKETYDEYYERKINEHWESFDEELELHYRSKFPTTEMINTFYNKTDDNYDETGSLYSSSYDYDDEYNYDSELYTDIEYNDDYDNDNDNYDYEEYDE